MNRNYVFFGQGCEMRETGENMLGSMEFRSAKTAAGIRGYSYSLTIGIEEGYTKVYWVGKG